MTLIEIPGFGKPRTVKDAVILILGREWPLSLKRINNSVKKMGFNVSYQAVHKVVQELVSEEIVLRKERNYMINNNWIMNLKSFVSSLDYRYSDIPVGDNMVFETLKDMDTFIMSMMKKIKDTGRMTLNCSHWKHTWWPLFATREEYMVIRDLPNPKKIFISCNGNGAVEKWCRKVYEEMGLNIKIGINGGNFDFMVYDDMVIQMYWPRDMREAMNRAFNVRDITNIDIEKVFTDVMERETKINVIIIKNKDIASLFNDEVLKHFK